MLLTTALKSWLVTNGTKATASDDEFKKAAGEALVTGKLTSDKFAELSVPEATPANEFSKKLDTLTEGIGNLVKLLTPTQKAADPDPTPAQTQAAQTQAAPTGEKGLSKAIAGMGGATAANDGADVRVKSAHEQYSTTKTALVYGPVTKSNRPHPFAGRQVVDYAGEAPRPLDTQSELEKAVAGAYIKLMCSTRMRGGSKTFGYQALNEHDRDLLQYGMREMKWAGVTGKGDDRFADIIDRKLTLHEQKALIDDSTSGGLEAAPIVFDDMIISAPLLNGELYPLVNTVPLDRGRRVEGVATGTVTGSWGGVDDSEIALFNTASYVSAFDTTIFRWEGAIRIGLDFLSDSPIDFGSHITAQYGERLLEDLDDVIATGNGSTQPEGIINKSGAGSVNFGATTSLGNYESLMFGIGKNERRPGLAASTVFCGTDTSYQRARAIPVGASDARRLGGTGGIGGVGDYLNYQWMGHPYKINNSLSNAQIFYAILGRYRMYRRRGLTMRTSTEGDTLIRRNEMLMVCMARYGGQQERGATCVVTTTAPT